jgi:hypothetical protein
VRSDLIRALVELSIRERTAAEADRLIVRRASDLRFDEIDDRRSEGYGAAESL